MLFLYVLLYRAYCKWLCLTWVLCLVSSTVLGIIFHVYCFVVSFIVSGCKDLWYIYIYIYKKKNKIRALTWGFLDGGNYRSNCWQVFCKEAPEKVGRLRGKRLRWRKVWWRCTQRRTSFPTKTRLLSMWLFLVAPVREILLKHNPWKRKNQISSAMVWCSRFIWIINSSDHRRVWTGNLVFCNYLYKK